jgi:hypothetical protein
VAIGVIVVVLFHMIGPSDLVSIIDDSEIRGLIDASSWDVSNILIIYIAIICISAFILSVSNQSYSSLLMTYFYNIVGDYH